MCVFEVMWGLIYKWFDDVGELLGSTISDGPPTGHNGSEGVPVLCILVSHKIWRVLHWWGKVVYIFG